MSSSQDPLFAGLGQAMRMGTDLLASLIVGGGLGWAADSYLFDSTPWLLIIGLCMGLVAGIRNAIRSAKKWDQS